MSRILMSDKEGLKSWSGRGRRRNPRAFWQALAPWPYSGAGAALLLPARSSQVSPAWSVGGAVVGLVGAPCRAWASPNTRRSSMMGG